MNVTQHLRQYRDACRSALGLTVDGGGRVISSTAATISVEARPYGADPRAADCTGAIQAAIDDIVSQYGTGVLIVPRVYRTQCLVVPDAVSIIGLSETESGFDRIDGALGPGIISKPTVGRSGSVRLRQLFSTFCYDGGNVGLLKISGTVTLASNQITGISGADLAVIAQVGYGWLVEGIGIPAGATVAGVNTGTGTVDMSVAATGSNGSRQKVVFRRAVAMTATGSTSSKVLTVADSSGVLPGMRASGALLEGDTEDDTADLKSWSRVLAVTPTTITLDRLPASSGTFALTCFVANDGILAIEADQADAYDAAKEYGALGIQHMQITKAGYHGLVVRPGRDQFHGRFSKVSSCYGYGIAVTGANDCYMERFSSGSNWQSNLLLSSMATPRWTGECFQTYLVDRFSDIRLQGVREISLREGELNGRLYVKGKTDSAAELVTVYAMNFKWTAANEDPTGTQQSVIVANSCNLQLTLGGFTRDRSTGDKPQYLMETVNGGKINATGMHWITDTTDVECPFSTAAVKPASNVMLSACRDDSTDRIMNSMTISDQTIANGDTVTLSRNFDAFSLNKADGIGIATLTVKLPSGAQDSEVAKFAVMVSVTTLTVQGQGGDTIVDAPTSCAAGQAFQFRYRASNAKWYPSPF